MGGGEGRHDLGVLRIQHPARKPLRQLRLYVVKLTRANRHGLDPGRPLPISKPLQSNEPLHRGGNDEPTLEVVLNNLSDTGLGGKLTPQPPGQQGKFKLGPRLLVGHEQIPLTRPSRPPSHGPTINKNNTKPRPSRVQGTGSPHHPGPNDDNIAGQQRTHPSTMSHVAGRAKGATLVMGAGGAPSGARGCIDLRLRRVGATSHNGPAAEIQPVTPPPWGSEAQPPVSGRGGAGERNPHTHPPAHSNPPRHHPLGRQLNPRTVTLVLCGDEGQLTTRKDGETYGPQILRHRVIGHFAGRDAVPENGRELGRRALRALSEAAQHEPGGLGEFDEEGAAPLAHQRSNPIDKRLPIIRLALMKHTPHIHVHVTELGMQRLRLTLLSRIEQPIRGLPRPIHTPSMIECGSREIGPDNVGVPVGKEPRLGPVTAP
ncbi:hypothetical protein GCM10023080_094780 [Streptomyces pseudoechinosporeus]